MSSELQLELLRHVRSGKISVKQALASFQSLKKNQPSTENSIYTPDICNLPVKQVEDKFDNVKTKWQTSLQNDLLELVAKILKLEEEKVNPDTPVVNLGLDSLSATEFNNYISNRYKIKISPTIFFECNTVNDFYFYLVKRYESQLSFYYQKSQGDSNSKMETSFLDQEQLSSVAQVEPEITEKLSSSPYKKTESYLEQLWYELEQSYDETNSQLDIQENSISISKFTIFQQANQLLITPPDGLTVEVFISGQGEPLLLLGGLLNPAEIWLHQFEVLEKDYKVIILNQPGCGQSRIVPNNLTIDLILDNIILALDLLNLDQPLSVIGYSFGGMVAQLLCLNHPQRIKSLVIACSTPSANSDSTDLQLLANELMKNQQFKDIVRDVSIKDLHPYYQAAKEFNVLGRLKEISVPTLILAGKEDRYMKPAYSQAIHQAIPQSEYLEVEGAGHIPLLTHPEDFNNKVCNFLRNLSTKIKITTKN